MCLFHVNFGGADGVDDQVLVIVTGITLTAFVNLGVWLFPDTLYKVSGRIDYRERKPYSDDEADKDAP